MQRMHAAKAPVDFFVAAHSQAPQRRVSLMWRCMSRQAFILISPSLTGWLHGWPWNTWNKHAQASSFSSATFHCRWCVEVNTASRPAINWAAIARHCSSVKLAMSVLGLTVASWQGKLCYLVTSSLGKSAYLISWPTQTCTIQSSAKRPS